MMNTLYLLPLTAMCLIVALVCLGFRAPSRRGYGPLIIGIAASAMMIGGKFCFANDYATFLGIALLIGASVWNSWPHKCKQRICK